MQLVSVYAETDRILMMMCPPGFCIAIIQATLGPKNIKHVDTTLALSCFIPALDMSLQSRMGAGHPPTCAGAPMLLGCV